MQRSLPSLPQLPKQKSPLKNSSRKFQNTPYRTLTTSGIVKKVVFRFPSKPMTLILIDKIHQLNEIVGRLENFFVQKSFTTRTDRDDICLRYLVLIFEHHRGIL